MPTVTITMKSKIAFLCKLKINITYHAFGEIYNNYTPNQIV